MVSRVRKRIELVKLIVPGDSFVFSLQISNRTWFCQLKLHYVDHLLQANMTGVAVCENPATLLQLALPLVSCRTTDVTVKLPLGTRLKRVKAPGKDGVVGRALTAMTPGSVCTDTNTGGHGKQGLKHDLVCKNLG